MNDDNGKKLLIGGGLIALGSIILNQIYTSGFEAGLIAGGGDPGAMARYGQGGFPGGFIFLLAIGGFIWWKMSNGGRRGPGGPCGFFGGRRGPGGFFDDRRQGGWPDQQQNQHQQPQPYGAPQQQPHQPYTYPAPGTTPQPPVSYGGQSAPPPPPADYSPPTPPAPGYPQPESGQPAAPPANPDPNKPGI